MYYPALSARLSSSYFLQFLVVSATKLAGRYGAPRSKCCHLNTSLPLTFTAIRRWIFRSRSLISPFECPRDLPGVSARWSIQNFFTRPQAPAFSSFTARIRASEKLDERYLRLMARRLSSPASRACTERYRYRKFKGISLPTNSMRPIDRRWFARFSSRVLNPKPDRLAMFLKPFLSSMDRSEPASSPAPSRARIVVATPPPPRPRIPVIAPVWDSRLIGLWHYTPTSRSGSASMISFRFRYFAVEGYFAEVANRFRPFSNLAAVDNGQGWRYCVRKSPRAIAEDERQRATFSL